MSGSVTLTAAPQSSRTYIKSLISMCEDATIIAPHTGKPIKRTNATRDGRNNHPQTTAERRIPPA